jgi:hypothetical protein
MSRRPETNEPDVATSHELVRELESAIAAREATADQARDDVARAQLQAEHLVAEAEAQAQDEAQRRRAAILAQAHAVAHHVTEGGINRAADLTATAGRRRESDIATVMSLVLPKPLRSPRER